MEENKIDIEKDHLVIIRDGRGAFHRFFWHSADKFSLAEIEAKIVDFNEKRKADVEVYAAELVTDKLVREICAYRQAVQPLEDIIYDAGKVWKKMDKAAEFLESAVSNLNSIRGAGLR